MSLGTHSGEDAFQNVAKIGSIGGSDEVSMAFAHDIQTKLGALNQGRVAQVNASRGGVMSR